MRNAKLDESQAGIKVARRNMNNLRYAEEAIMMAEVEEEVKSFLMRVKKESEKAGLKFNIQKKKKIQHSKYIQAHHFMASRWGKSGRSDRFNFLGLRNHCGW